MAEGNERQTDRVDSLASPAGEPESFLVRHRYVVVALLAALLFIPFLGGRDLWYPDEPDIGEVAVAMYESGDWVAPRRMGVIWVDYPPLLYWAGVASSHAFGGVSAFSLRLPNALAALALVLLTCVAGSRIFDARAGLWAGVTMATFQHFVLQAVGYRPDVFFSLFIAAGLLVYAAGAGERPRWWLRAAGFALLGLAMLSKGPLGLLLPGLVLTLWHGWRREWRRLFELAPLALVSLAVYLPWFAACAHAMGSDNILHELYAQNVARFFGGDRGHRQPPWYYFLYIWGDLFPWGPLLPFAIWWSHRERLWRRREVQILGWWLGAFFVFLTIATTKRELYMLPAYPAAALLLAPWLSRFGETERSRRPSPRFLRAYSWGLAGLFVALGLVMAVAGGPAFGKVLERADLPRLQLDAAYATRMPLMMIGVIFLIAAAAFVQALWRRDEEGLLWRIASSQIALYAVVFALAFPAIDPIRSYRVAGEWVGEHIGDQESFGLYWPESNLGFRKMGAFGYFSGKKVKVLYAPSEVEEFFARHPDSVVVVHESAVDDLAAADPEAWSERVVRDDIFTGKRRYVVAKASPSGSRP